MGVLIMARAQLLSALVHAAAVRVSQSLSASKVEFNSRYDGRADFYRTVSAPVPGGWDRADRTQIIPE